VRFDVVLGLHSAGAGWQERKSVSGKMRVLAQAPPNARTAVYDHALPFFLALDGVYRFARTSRHDAKASDPASFEAWNQTGALGWMPSQPHDYRRIRENGCNPLNITTASEKITASCYRRA
jgi:hypothetical protein